MIVWLDLFSCLVFLGSIPFITQHFRDRAEEVDAHNVTASDYSVWVWGVPDNVTQQQGLASGVYGLRGLTVWESRIQALGLGSRMSARAVGWPARMLNVRGWAAVRRDGVPAQEREQQGRSAPGGRGASPRDAASPDEEGSGRTERATLGGGGRRRTGGGRRRGRRDRDPGDECLPYERERVCFKSTCVSRGLACLKSVSLTYRCVAHVAVAVSLTSLSLSQVCAARA
eukprot:372468-Rhodomonas_salina.2